MEAPQEKKLSSTKPELTLPELFSLRKIEHPTTPVGAVAHMLKGTLGTGILAMPMAFLNSGLLVGVVACLLTGLLCMHCVHILVKSSHEVCRRLAIPSLDFNQTAEKAFECGPMPLRKYSRFAGLFVSVGLVLTHYIGVTVYLVFIAKSLQQVIDWYVGSTFDVRLYMVILFVPVALLCTIRNIKYLVPFSSIANIFIGIGFLITLYYIFRDPLDELPERALAKSILDFPVFFSTMLFAMEGIGVVLTIENSMDKPAAFLGFPGVLTISMAIALVMYVCTGVFGYMKYGEETQPTITLNLPNDEVLAQFVKLAVALAVFFSYPLQYFVPASILLRMLQPYVKERNWTIFQIAFRVVGVALTVVLAVAIPVLEPIIGLMGSIFLSTLGLFCPAFLESMVFWEEKGGHRSFMVWKNYFIMLCSIVALLAGTYVSILGIVEAYRDIEAHTRTLS